MDGFIVRDYSPVPINMVWPKVGESTVVMLSSYLKWLYLLNNIQYTTLMATVMKRQPVKTSNYRGFNFAIPVKPIVSHACSSKNHLPL